MRHMVETTVIEENNVRQYILDEKLETFSVCLAEYLDIGGDSHLGMIIRHSKCEIHVLETLCKGNTSPFLVTALSSYYSFLPIA